MTEIDGETNPGETNPGDTNLGDPNLCDPLRGRDPRAYRIAEGHVDIFLAPLRESKTFDASDATGPRTHVVRVREGGVLFGIGAAAHPAGWTLLGRPTPGTRMERLNPDELSEHLLEEWVALLTAAVAPAARPGEYRRLAPDATFEIPADPLPLSAREAIVWLRHLRGDGWFLGNRNLRLGAEDTHFPLTGYGWVEEQSGNRVLTASTGDVFQSGAAWAGLNLFHRIVCQALVLARQTAEKEERTQLAKRESRDVAELSASLRQLAGPLTKSGRKKFLPSETGDALLRACQAAGEQLGISFTISPEQIRGLPVRNPVWSLCRAAGARARRVTLDELWYRREGQPLVAFRRSNGQPLALLPRRFGGYTVYDPVAGTRTPATRELAASLDPRACSFYRGFGRRPVKLTELCLFGLKGCWRDVALIAVLAIANMLLGMTIPILTGHLFDSVIPGGKRGLLLETALFVLAGSLAATLTGLTIRFSFLRIENQVEARVQAAIWIRLLSLPAPFFRQFTAGDLASRAMAIGSIRQILTSSTMATAFSGLFSLGNFALLFYYSVPLALVAALLIMIELATIVLAGFIQLRVQRSGADSQGRLAGLLLQLIGNITKFRVSATENRAFMAWSRVFSVYRSRTMRMSRVSNAVTVFNWIYSIAALMALFWTAGRLMTLSGGTAFSTGDFIAFLTAFGSISGALTMLGEAAIGSMTIVPLYRRARTILDALPETDPSQTISDELAGGIEIRNVSFRYRKDGQTVIRNMSLDIAPGEFAAIVGASGSGKSTLMRLLLGLEKPDSGSILFDGQDIATLDISSLRAQIGVILQTSTIFGGDVYSNITASGPFSPEEAWEAARIAGLEEDLRAMPMGMYTVVGEGGTGLSGGQRQRLMIARAVVGKPRVLFLDEATSALDNRTQEKVSRGLEQLRSTRVVIAHRLSTVMSADRIFVFDHGSVVQTGKYENLIAQPGIFADLAKRQLT